MPAPNQTIRGLFTESPAESSAGARGPGQATAPEVGERAADSAPSGVQRRQQRPEAARAPAPVPLSAAEPQRRGPHDEDFPALTAQRANRPSRLPPALRNSEATSDAAESWRPTLARLTAPVSKRPRAQAPDPLYDPLPPPPPLPSDLQHGPRPDGAAKADETADRGPAQPRAEVEAPRGDAAAARPRRRWRWAVATLPVAAAVGAAFVLWAPSSATPTARHAEAANGAPQRQGPAKPDRLTAVAPSEAAPSADHPGRTAPPSPDTSSPSAERPSGDAPPAATAADPADAQDVGDRGEAEPAAERGGGESRGSAAASASERGARGEGASEGGAAAPSASADADETAGAAAAGPELPPNPFDDPAPEGIADDAPASDDGAEAGAEPADGAGASEPERELAERPTRSEVDRALRAVRDEVRQCAPGRSGKIVTAKITVRSSGRVTTAEITGKFAGTAEGSCMARAIRKARLSPFRQSRVVVEYPFAL